MLSGSVEKERLMKSVESNILNLLPSSVSSISP